jgi:O-antigen/teichoic acid export membrane protein
LGFYRTANVITYLLPNAVLSQTRQVVFSDIAQRKDDSGYSSLRYYQFFRIIGAVSFVLSITIYFLSGFFITVVMGSKWEQVIPLVKVFAASLPTGMAVAINYDYSKILGFSHVYTVLTVIRAAATLAVLFICSLFSLGLTVVCLVVVSILDNAVCEVLFFKNQNTVRYNVSKLVFHLAAWVWAAYVITASHMRF